MDELSVRSQLDGEVSVVSAAGRVDSVTAMTLDAELGRIAHESIKLVLDLKDVVYLSSAGVRAILGASQRSKGRWRDQAGAGVRAGLASAGKCGHDGAISSLPVSGGGDGGLLNPTETGLRDSTNLPTMKPGSTPDRNSQLTIKRSQHGWKIHSQKDR